MQLAGQGPAAAAGVPAAAGAPGHVLPVELRTDMRTRGDEEQHESCWDSFHGFTRSKERGASPGRLNRDTPGSLLHLAAALVFRNCW